MADVAMSSVDVFAAPASSGSSATSRRKPVSELLAPANDFDWAGYAHAVQGARQAREGRLMWDCLAGDVGLTYDYPPTSAAALVSLVETIQTVDAGRHDRDVLLLYLLLDLQTDSDASVRARQSAAFCTARHLPAWRRALVEGYSAADHSDWPRAIALLAGVGAPLPPHHVDALLGLLAIPTLDLPPRLALNLFRGAAIPVDTSHLRSAYVRALAGADFGKAWLWVWDGAWTRVEEGDEVEEGKERQRLIQVLLEWSLMPRPRKAALEALLTLPFDSAIHTQLTSYLLQPPASLPASSFGLLHDLLHLRLVAHGEYAAAVDLERRVRALGRPAQAGEAESDRERTARMCELVQLLPKVQRDMLSLDEMEAPSGPSGAGEDLAMSWEPVDLGASVSGNAATVPAANNPRSTRTAGAGTSNTALPLSASPALRTATPSSNPILHAVRAVHPASPVPGPQRFSPGGGAASARRPEQRERARGMDSPLRGLLARTASPYTEAGAGHSASPFAEGQRIGSAPPRNISGAGLLRLAVAAQQQATPTGAMRGSPTAQSTEQRKQATPVPTRVFRRLGGWDEEEAQEPQGHADREQPQTEEQASQQAASDDEDRRKNQEEDQSEPEQRPKTRATRSRQPAAKRDSPKRKEAAEEQPEAAPAKRTRRSRAPSSQPASSPPPTRSRQASSQPDPADPPRRATRKSTKPQQSMGQLPGAFPGTVPEEPEQQESEQPQEEEEPTKSATRQTRRTRSVEKTSEAEDQVETEKTPARRAKRKQSSLAPPSRKDLRMTRAQSVLSNATTEAGDDESVASTTRRRSARLSSAAPSSPARSEVSLRQTRSRKATQDPEPTPTVGVRTRRQAASGKTK